MSDYTERYNALKLAGTCVSCKVRDPIPDRTQCGACAEAQVEQRSALIARRVADGKCPHCGNAPTPGYKTCLVARQRDQAYRHRGQVPT